jgi:nucleoside-diphosphate-sugar epimerase
MKILITGIHGFVGSNLVNSLNKKYELYGLDIQKPIREGVIKTYSWQDIEPLSYSMQKLLHIDVIIHLAGKAHDTNRQSDTQLYFDINTGLTKKIFDFFIESSATKFFFFSSVKAAADFVPDEILTENILPIPQGAYGESKIAAEKYINSKTTIINTFEKKVYILRPCMIHGPGNKGNLNLLFNAVKKGIPWPLGAFENRRSFTSIDNLCYIIDNLLTKDIESGIYHIGDDEAISTNELIETICSIMEKKTKIWRINKKIMKLCANIGSVLHLPLDRKRLQKLTENYIVSNAKIKNALGIDRLPVTAKDGLIKTIKSFM